MSDVGGGAIPADLASESSERARSDGLWGHEAEAALPLVLTEPSRRGTSVVQIQRTIPAAVYKDGSLTTGSRSVGVAAGERSIFAQYRSAIAAAQQSSYIENQAVEVTEIVVLLREALERNIEVVLSLPGEPDPLPDTDSRRAFLDARAALGAYANFNMAGLAGLDGNGDRRHVHVHSKLMLIDDEWATIGSCNLHAASLLGNTEMNASFWDPDVVRQLRCQLFEEHLGESTEHLDAASSHKRFGAVARENRRRWTAGDTTWRGLAFSLDPANYGRSE